jgi:hypothetical protein
MFPSFDVGNVPSEDRPLLVFFFAHSANVCAFGIDVFLRSPDYFSHLPVSCFVTAEFSIALFSLVFVIHEITPPPIPSCTDTRKGVHHVLNDSSLRIYDKKYHPSTTPNNEFLADI